MSYQLTIKPLGHTGEVAPYVIRRGTRAASSHGIDGKTHGGGPR